MRSITLTANAYGVTDKSDTAHLKGGVTLTSSGDIVVQTLRSYCGQTIRGPVPAGGWRDSDGYRTGRDCLKCVSEYRLANGVSPVTFDF